MRYHIVMEWRRTLSSEEGYVSEETILIDADAIDIGRI